MNNKRYFVVSFLIIQIIIIIYFLNLSPFSYNNAMIKMYQKEIDENKLHDLKISVIILNFSRPHNLRKSLPILSSYKFIDEIIVSHGKPETFENFDYNGKVRNFKDYELDKKYGAAIRFFHYKNCKNKIILFLDDDTLPSESLVDYTLMLLLKNYDKDTIFGTMGRICDKFGYFPESRFTLRKSNVVLTPFLMCKKSIIKNYMKSKDGFKKYEKWIIDHKGNCEDISLNLFLKEYYNNYPVRLVGWANQLDITNGYSSSNNHWNTRSEFCIRYNS